MTEIFLMEPQPLYQELILRLNQKKIKYSLLRDFLLDDPNLVELDLLVWPESKSGFLKILNEVGFVALKTGILNKEVFAYFDEKKLKLLDVHYGLVQGGFKYHSLNKVYPRLMETASGNKKLSNEDELLHLFYHNLIGKNHLQKKHLSQIGLILKKQLDKTYLKSCISSVKTRKIFTQFIENPGQFSEKNSLTKKAAGQIRRSLKYQFPMNLFRRFYSRRLRKRLFPKRGVVFAFLGVDGAGKSTLLKAVQAKLQDVGNIKIELTYMGPWGFISSPFLKWCKKTGFTPSKENWVKILSDKIKGKGIENSYPHILSKLIKSKFRGWMYYLGVYGELWYRYMRDVRPQLKRGGIILTDRYIYDIKFIYKTRAMEQFKFWRYFICKFFPSPNLIVWVKNTPENIIKRKAQLNEQQINQFQAFYSKAFKNYPMVEVVSNGSPDTLANDMVKKIVTYYLKRDLSAIGV